MDALKRLSVAERLRELAWEGFTPADIAEAASVPVDVIEGLYENPTASHWHRKVVERAWVRLMPPVVDEVAVERVIDGDYPAQLAAPVLSGVRRSASWCYRGGRTARSPNASAWLTRPSPGSSCPSASSDTGR